MSPDSPSIHRSCIHPSIQPPSVFPSGRAIGRSYRRVFWWVLSWRRQNLTWGQAAGRCWAGAEWVLSRGCVSNATLNVMWSGRAQAWGRRVRVPSRLASARPAVGRVLRSLLFLLPPRLPIHIAGIGSCVLLRTSYLHRYDGSRWREQRRILEDVLDRLSFAAFPHDGAISASRPAPSPFFPPTPTQPLFPIYIDSRFLLSCLPFSLSIRQRFHRNQQS